MKNSEEEEEPEKEEATEVVDFSGRTDHLIGEEEVKTFTEV